MAERDPRIVRAVPGYRQDGAAWIEHQLELLRERRFDELDTEMLIEEVEGLSRSEFRAFSSAIEIVIFHMLKWDHQPSGRSQRSWWMSIDEHRDRIAYDLEDSPSYRARLDEAVLRAYRAARRSASAETNLPLKTFPEQCPYSWDEIVSRDHPHAD